MSILMSKNALCLWRDVLNEAISSVNIQLEPRLEEYVIHLLLERTSGSDLFATPFSISFLAAIQALDDQKRETLFRDVADGCLLISGLFPQYAKKRVNLAYFVRLGQRAYQQLSFKQNDLYSALAFNFVNMMDILQETKKNCTDQLLYLPLDVYEQWAEVGSIRAFQLIKSYTQNALPTIRVTGKK